MGETALVTSDSHSSAASLSKEAEGNCKNVKGPLSSKSSNPSCNTNMSSSKVVGGQCVQNGAADVNLCPKDHICHKCCSSLYGCTSTFYGAQDYVPEYSRSFTKTRSNYNTEAVMDGAGTDIKGNWWQGSYHY